VVKADDCKPKHSFVQFGRGKHPLSGDGNPDLGEPLFLRNFSNQPIHMEFISLAMHRQLEADGDLHINNHAEFPLLIHNYAAQVQYNRNWTAPTLMSRGLITDQEGRVVARPFGKFFNLDEYIGLFGDLPGEGFDVYEKMDGSLGILYFWDGKPYIATRGSFHSEQADFANALLRTKYAHVAFDPAYTYLFEIIYPENRIVVDYGGMEDLVLLSIVHTATGVEQTLSPTLDLPTVRRYDGIADLDSLRALEEDNKEGFVVRFHGGLRVKVKFEEYVRLHRVMTGMNSRMIWEHLSNGEDLAAVLEKVPDEFYNWVRRVEAELKAEFAEMEAQAKAEFRVLEDRKATAQYFLTSCAQPAILFKMLDGQPYAHIIWKLIRPAHRPAFRNDQDI
jgi:RNA ligase